MSYLWHLDGLSMALGIGELDGCTRFMVHGDLNTRFFSHEIFWTRIARITRMFFCTLEHEIFLNTNNSNNTNIFWHTDLTDLTDFEPSARCERQLVVVIDSLWLLTCCGYWLVMVIDSLWLLTCCGYWLVVVIGLLCFKWQIKKDVREPCEALADPWDLWDPCAK